MKTSPKFKAEQEEAAKTVPARELEQELSPRALTPAAQARDKILNDLARDRAMGATAVQLAVKYAISLEAVEKLLRQKAFVTRVQSWLEELRVPTRQVIALHGRDAMAKRAIMVHDELVDGKTVDSITRHQVEMAEGKPIQSIETRNFNFEVKREMAIEAEIIDLDKQIAEAEKKLLPMLKTAPPA